MHQNLFALHSCGNKIECVHDEKKRCILIRLMANKCTMPSICISYNRMPIAQSSVRLYFQFLIAFITRYFAYRFVCDGRESEKKQFSNFQNCVRMTPNGEKIVDSLIHSIQWNAKKQITNWLLFIYLQFFNSIFTCRSRTCASHSLSGYRIHLFCASNIVFIINSFFPMQFDSQLESRLIYWHFRCTLTDIQRCFALFAAAVAASLRV